MGHHVLVAQLLTQHVPFAYVHIVSLLVNFNTLILAVKCGVASGNAFVHQNYTAIFYEAAILTYGPLCQALLAISYAIHDPFGEDVLDFPIAAYSEYVAMSCEAGITGPSAYPGLQKAIE